MRMDVDLDDQREIQDEEYQSKIAQHNADLQASGNLAAMNALRNDMKKPKILPPPVVVALPPAAVPPPPAAVIAPPPPVAAKPPEIPPPVSRTYKDSALIHSRELGGAAGVVGGGAAYYYTAELAAQYAANAATAVGVRWVFWQAARALVTSVPVAIAGGGLYAGCRIYNAYGAPALERENEKLAKRNEYLESLLPKNSKSQ